ncbi:aminodeoxyfutalosine synthase [Desulfosarcina sp. BuS5]|uniref:aminofutalosine synthase MqnE n=1 Tax=Desulfosarcina sp. BuS5 TaxID=933262 RepID=UPI000484ABF6|nr:aminofutalosine synthase MqnE [Desulfosarcina sp. BuS5]WDN88979.1 aminodeoxyfutalosine synthase [Desulfosarcina sp. BuS5]
MLNSSFLDNRLDKIQAKIAAGQRLDFKDGLILYESHDLPGIGRIADFVRRQQHDNDTFFVYNQHINYTNLCINGCKFCAYSRDEKAGDSFTLNINDVNLKVLERMDEPVREFHIVGGLNPALPFNYYIDLIKSIKELRPDATIKAFTAVEIDFIAQTSGLALDETLARLIKAGLSMMPGGGAEIMSSRVREKLFPKKISAQRWLEVMAAAHKAGITSNATMLYGHIETNKERVNHLILLRELQDQTGGFSAFIPLAFHPQNTQLSHLHNTTACDDLKNIAIARLMLDNFDHIKAYWIMIGEKLAQVALSFGADDLDGTIIEEKITHMAGATSAKGMSREEMKRIISAAGFTPVERDSFYNPVTELDEN